MITAAAPSCDFLTIALADKAGHSCYSCQTRRQETAASSHGAKDASTDPEQIAAWAEQFPDANVGVVCREGGICIVDDDEGVVEAWHSGPHSRGGIKPWTPAILFPPHPRDREPKSGREL